MKKDIIESLAINSKDTGSVEVQIGLLSEKIKKLSKNKTNWELLASNIPTKFKINQTIKGISIPDVILIDNHFFVALII